ncbi:MAG: metallopeptidase family protein [Nitrospirota bacterium]|nr:metallopeptidase family protein [Nitrospirota bacterium]
MDQRAFERLVGESVETLPARFRTLIENVAFIVEQWPDDETMEEMGLDSPYDLLGLYRGIPLEERGFSYGNQLPDTISIYQKPIEVYCRDTGEDIAVVIKETVIHEVGHYFSLSDEEMERIEHEAGL